MMVLCAADSFITCILSRDHQTTGSQGYTAGALLLPYGSTIRGEEEQVTKKGIASNLASKAMRKQQPVEYSMAATRFVDDSQSAPTSKDSFVVDIPHGDVATTASTTSSYQDDFHHYNAHNNADATTHTACDWDYVRGEIR
jgi:hypothetical protein